MAKKKAVKLAVSKEVPLEPKKLSFVVPVYKTEKYLKESLESLIKQDYRNIEIIVVLDGPSDEAQKIVQDLKNPRIQLFEIQHSGAPKARNEGFKHTTGDYVSFWDSDCYAEVGMARMWVKYFGTGDYDFVYCDYRFKDENMSAIIAEPFNPYILTCNNYIATMFPMKREIFPTFDESLLSLQDWDMWLTIVEKGGKGAYFPGSSFTTEMRQGISSVGCTDEEWLNRYNTVRNKHNIKGRDICFTSQSADFRAKQLAEMFGQDYCKSPGYHPHEYKAIYCIGFYPMSSLEASESFKKAQPYCKKIVHWLGEDAEHWLMQPFKGVKMTVEAFNKPAFKHYCENEITQILLKEMGIDAQILSLPMKVIEVPKSEEFKIYYETDNYTAQLVSEIASSNPDLKFENKEQCELKDYALFLSLTASTVPSENIKRFIASGRYVITNYKLPYANYTEVKREPIVRKIRELKHKWKEGYKDEKAVKYYTDLLNPDNFIKTVKEAL